MGNWVGSFVCFNETATNEIYTYRHTLSLHDALPILPDDSRTPKAANGQATAVTLCRRVRSAGPAGRSEEHTSELQSLMRISYAVFCLKKKIYLNHYILLFLLPMIVIFLSALNIATYI